MTRELIEQYLRKYPGGGVIICSGYVEEELLKRDIDAGKYDYLAKPFSPDALIGRLRKLVAS